MNNPPGNWQQSKKKIVHKFEFQNGWFLAKPAKNAKNKLKLEHYTDSQIEYNHEKSSVNL